MRSGIDDASRQGTRLLEILQSAWVWWPLLCIVTGTVVWLGGSALLWAIVGVPTILAFSLLSDAGLGAKIALWTVFVAAFAVLGVPPVRRRLITVRVMRMMSVEMPSISATERQALEAGGAGWEKELFGGRPVWRRLRRISASRLTEKEQVWSVTASGRIPVSIISGRISAALPSRPTDMACLSCTARSRNSAA